MKLIALNIWGGKKIDELVRFLSEYADKIEIFCFQDVYNTETDVKESRGVRTTIYHEISRVLPTHQGYFAPVHDHFDHLGETDFPLETGNATFVRKDIPVLKQGDFFVYGERNQTQVIKDGEIWNLLPRSVLYTQIRHNEKTLTMFNFYGLWNGKGKTDSEDRLNQSRMLKGFMNGFSESHLILCGDFNLLPTTESFSILEAGMRNLVNEYQITSTRSDYYTKPDKFADYIFVSPQLAVKDFRTLPVEVSDHLPLLLDFEG